MKRTPRNYLEDMLNFAREALESTEGMTFEAFRRDRKTLNALLRSLEVLGEAVKKIPDQVRVKYSELPWRDIPSLIPLLEKILREESQ